MYDVTIDSRVRWRWLSAGVFLFAFGLRLSFIGQGSLWLDEVMQMRVALGDSFEQGVGRGAPTTSPPLVYWQLHLMAKVSLNEFWLRLSFHLFLGR